MAKKPVAPGLSRPVPPESFTDPLSARYAPAPEVLTWARSTILTEGGQLHNPDHAHLEYCDVQFLWAPSGFNKQGRTVIGQCEEVLFRCGPWQKGRQQQQMVDWFGIVPDYLITLDASYCLKCSDAEFCALVEHELYHIGQEQDEFGSPAFTKDGMPKLMIKGHDVEEFVGVVRRYGVGHPEGTLAQLVAAANAAPEVAKINIARACGTCLLKAA
ncbi:putative metallopeptidase [Duganella margarita]|uniref:putative metallopeptidase n=1 Tax=Duganella margarita TaxID=2692170 RepID=UPI0019270E66|nr:putative metallopeptidase [Duganella margarita]